jgi:hypothetical protein
MESLNKFALLLWLKVTVYLLLFILTMTIPISSDLGFHVYLCGRGVPGSAWCKPVWDL